jgi:hypothetical protein
MTALTWDGSGTRLYETGVDKAVLYIPDVNGVYNTGFAWNGLTTVTESPSGAESSAQYADNIKYLNLVSAEEFGATIEAFTYPDEFAQCDGSATPVAGVHIGQQTRKMFGLSYRTKVGDDLVGSDKGYKLHLVYGCQAAPTEKAYSTVNDSPEAITFSWEVTTTPTAVTGYKNTAILTIDSTKVVPANLAALELVLYGTVGVDPLLPTPDAVIAAITTVLTAVDLGTPANQPTYVSGTHIITLPSVTGVTWKINGVTKTAGAQPALTTGQVANVLAVASTGYRLVGDSDWTFNY